LAQEAEKVKHVLSTLDTAHCFVESLFDGMDFSTNVTRARFDNEISKVIKLPYRCVIVKNRMLIGEQLK
jgi:molecular chaperone DnaK (HSP70)